MSRLQDNEEYKKFITHTVYPIVNSLETRGWLFGGNGKNITAIAYPICQEDIEDLKSGKYNGHKYQIGNYSEGTVLVKHPFRPYQLIPSDTSETDIINDHLTDLATIFTALGATDCEETAKITKTEKLEKNFWGKMRFKTVKVKGEMKEKSENSMDSEYKLVIKHKPDDKNGFDNAYRMAEKYGLLEVKKIRDIFELFDPEKGGKTTSYQLSEVLTEDYHKTLDAVLEINASKVFKFNGKLNIDHKCRRTIRIDKIIHFE